MKIVCSIGPNVKNNQCFDKLVESGMDIMRINFSHINYVNTKAYIKYVKENFKNINIVGDLQGNKLRVSKLFNEQKKVFPKEKVFFCDEEFYVNNKSIIEDKIIIPIAFQGEFSSICKVDKILMKDGTMEFKVLETGKNNNILKAEVIRGGIIRKEKGINVPLMNRSSLKLTAKDKNDIIFSLENNLDIICLSYVTKGEDIRELKAFLNEVIKNNNNYTYPKIWAKIECRDGVNNFKEILDLVDGIIIGRGDLYSEVELYEIPIIQENIINAMKYSEKELIIATYVMNSMKNSKKPTIPEIDDIYNFIKNKVDGIMLAGEITIGKYPYDTINITRKLIKEFSNII